MMTRKSAWIFLLVAFLVLGGCWADFGDDDDDDNQGNGRRIQCEPEACEAIESMADCENYEDDADVYAACQLCLAGTLKDQQVAQCMLDYRHEATGEQLRTACEEAVEEDCGLGMQ